MSCALSSLPVRPVLPFCVFMYCHGMLFHVMICHAMHFHVPYGMRCNVVLACPGLCCDFLSCLCCSVVPCPLFVPVVNSVFSCAVLCGCIAMSCHVVLCQLSGCSAVLFSPVLSCPACCNARSCQLLTAMSCRAMQCIVMSCHACCLMQCTVMLCHVRHALTCHVMQCKAL